MCAVPLDKQCRECNVQLVPYVNWTKGEFKVRSNICKDCKNKRGVNHRIELKKKDQSKIGCSLVTIKKCRGCNVILKVGNNWLEVSRKSYNYICNKCKTQESYKWRNSNKERYLINKRKRYQKNIVKERQKAKLYRLNNTEKALYSQYKSAAKSRDRVFCLTFEEFMCYWQQSCSYCGDEISTIGLDRVNNLKGYTKENITSCCIICNRMKRDFSYEVFINRCMKIVKKGEYCGTADRSNSE